MQTMSLGYEIWQWIVLIVLLLPESIQDIKKRKIHPALIISFTVFAIFAYDFTISGNHLEGIINLIPGLLMITMAILLRNLIGLGDGLIVLFIGSVCGIRNTFFILILAFCLCGLTAMFLLMLKKASRTTPLPFVPFAFAASMICGGIL